MVGVILAAGAGRRLGGMFGDIPKCLITIGNDTILGWQVRAFAKAGVRRFVVVVGHHAEAVKQKFDEVFPYTEVDFVINPDYATTNTLYSLHLALKGVEETVLFANGDVFFGPKLVARLFAGKNSALAIHSHPCGEEEVKVVMESNRLVEIGKGIDPKRAEGEFVGVALWRKEDLMVIKEALTRRASTPEGRKLFFEAAIQDIIHFVNLYGVDVTDLPVMEIDFPEDYHRACELVPAVKAEWERI